MTPKEKSEELISKFEKIKDSLSPHGSSLLFDKEAIECALITVKQLINEYPSFPRGTWEESRALYWLEVKKDLELKNATKP